jgi:hypothetical protein
MKQHALLSASSSKMWINCPPSARLNEKAKEESNKYADEGTDAHTLAEYKLGQALGIDMGEDVRVSLKYYDDEMERHTDDYVEYIITIVKELESAGLEPHVIIEQRLDYSRYVPGGFGTGDCVIACEGSIYVIDFKYGQGITVEATENPQMRLYALGALELFDYIYKIDEVYATIFQPRRDNISTEHIVAEELLDWADTVVTPAAKLADKGEGEFDVGEWCRYCRVGETCRARAEYNLEMAQYIYTEPPLLENEEVEYVLDRIDELVNWANSVKEYAFSLALNGHRWNHFKLVHGRSDRKYTDPAAVIEKLVRTGYLREDVCKPEAPLGITAMEKLIGKKQFAIVVGDLVEKPQGKPVLVSRNDNREEYKPGASPEVYEED